MILTSIRCICNENYEDSDPIDDANILKNFECNHFKVNGEIEINNKKLENYILMIECNNCNHKVTIKNENNLKNYKCNKCENFGSLSFKYNISQNDYHTPKEDFEQGNKINLKFVYEFKNYNIDVNGKDKIEKYYDNIRQKINFPKGKKILLNSEPVDLSKTFEEYNIQNQMTLEIED